MAKARKELFMPRQLPGGFKRKNKKLFGEMLLADQIVTPKMVEEAWHKQNTTMGHRMIGEILVRLGYISQAHIGPILAKQFRLRQVGKEVFENISQKVINEIDGNIATLYRFIPIRKTAKTLTIATAKPLDNLERVNQLLGESEERKIIRVVASPDLISEALRQYYGLKEDAIKEMLRRVELPTEQSLPTTLLVPERPAKKLTLEERVRQLEEQVEDLTHRLEQQEKQNIGNTFIGGHPILDV